MNNSLSDPVDLLIPFIGKFKIAMAIGDAKQRELQRKFTAVRTKKKPSRRTAQRVVIYL
jgi:hypothetical protein